MPAKQKVSDDEIVALLKRGLTWAEMHKYGGLSRSGGLYDRVHRVAAKHGLQVPKHYPSRTASHEDKRAAEAWDTKLQNHARRKFQIDTGTILIGSDAHYYPGIVSTAHRAFCKLARELKPSAVILNGDAFDGGTISRFPRIGWDSKPTVQQELETCLQRMTEIEDACGTKNLFWPLGNHDARYETFLASRVPEYQGVEGFHLKDKFPLWAPCWAVFVNDSVVVKHRYKNGIHATHQNTVSSGRSIVTGHLHSLKVTPFSDYDGTRFGVDCGTLASPQGPQFDDYIECNPVNWRSGFAVLTFHNGRLLWPEVVHVIDEEAGLVEFRGKVIEV
jgi:hypothetical protein